LAVGKNWGRLTGPENGKKRVPQHLSKEKLEKKKFTLRNTRKGGGHTKA